VSGRRFLGLLVAALVVIAGAFWLASQRHLPRDTAYGTPVLPALSTKLDAITGARIIGAGNHVLVTIERRDGRYRVLERSGYPADAGRMRTLLLALTGLKLHELKTADPARYAVLGVEDPKGADAKSVQVELTGPTPPVSLIVGHPSTAGDALFVRLPAAAQAMEAGPSFTVEKDPKNWLDRAILDVAADRVNEVDVTRADGPPWRAIREHQGDVELKVPDVPKGRSLSSPAAPNPVVAALARLEADDVKPAAGVTPPAAAHRVVYRTFDGLTVTVRGWGEGDDRWIAVEAEGTPVADAASAGGAAPASAPAASPPAASTAPAPAAAASNSATASGASGSSAPPAVPAAKKPDARQEAQEITERTRGWLYKVATYRYDDLFRARDALLKSETPAKASTAPKTPKPPKK
jgi:Domain of unknown function (DUF4340)